MRESPERSLQAVEKWVEDRDYKGYDPGDGLTSFLRPITFGNLLAERLLQQAIWKSPVNIRPLIGVKPLDSSKGRGFMAWGYLMRYRATGAERYRDKARACLSWLDRTAEAGHPGHCWGNHFDFSTRSGCMKAHTPTIVWSGLIGQAFMEGYEQLGDRRLLEVSESICQWILQLPREKTAAGDCLSYTPVVQASVHNSNLLGAGMLARTWKQTRNEEYLRVARAAAQYSCARQREDGSWWYGEESKYRWIDNFHTAYNLDSLKRYIEYTGDDSLRTNLHRGYDYFKRVFFDPSGRPRYYHDKAFPVDIQCASQAIDTFSFFADVDPDALQWAQRVADWTIREMQGSDGHFYYRRYPMITAKTPYFHWGQATMYKALSHLLLATGKRTVRAKHVIPASVAAS